MARAATGNRRRNWCRSSRRNPSRQKNRHNWSHSLCRCGQAGSDNLTRARGQWEERTGAGWVGTDQSSRQQVLLVGLFIILACQQKLETSRSCRRSRAPSTPPVMSVDSLNFGESCDGSPQPLAVESIAKTSTRLELIIALSCQGRLIRSRWKKVLAQTGLSGRVLCGRAVGAERCCGSGGGVAAQSQGLRGRRSRGGSAEA